MHEGYVKSTMKYIWRSGLEYRYGFCSSLTKKIIFPLFLSLHQLHVSILTIIKMHIEHWKEWIINSWNYSCPEQKYLANALNEVLKIKA